MSEEENIGAGKLVTAREAAAKARGDPPPRNFEGAEEVHQPTPEGDVDALELLSKAPGAPRKRPKPFRHLEDDVLDDGIRKRLDVQFAKEPVMDPMSATSEEREMELEKVTGKPGTSECFLIGCLEEYFEFENAVALYMNEPSNYIRGADREDPEAPKGEFPDGFSFDCPIGLWRCYEARRRGFAAACMHCFGPRVQMEFAERMHAAAASDVGQKPDIKKLWPFLLNECYCVYHTQVLEALTSQNDLEKAEGEWKKMIKTQPEMASTFLIDYCLASLIMPHFPNATSFTAFRNSLEITYVKEFQVIYDDDAKRIYRTVSCCIGQVPFAIRLYESDPHMVSMAEDILRVGCEKLVYRYGKQELAPFEIETKAIPIKASFILLIVPDEELLTPF